MTTLTQSFTAALAANRLLQPAGRQCQGSSAGADQPRCRAIPRSPARARVSATPISTKLRGALARGDLAAADTWLNEARTIGFSGEDLKTAEAEPGRRAREGRAAHSVVGEKSLQRLEYVAPKFPASTRNRGSGGWVEMEFTVRTDGSTSDIVVTNSNPRRTFDAAAITAVSQWRYKPVMSKDGKPVEQRVAVRIRFADE